MSIFSELISSLTGSNTSSENAVTERPCANCPSDCAIAGEACPVCEPYKKKLIDIIYYVDHLDEFYAKYEVTGDTAVSSAGAGVKCPYCGGQSTNAEICDFCGSRLSETASTGKIKVSKASDIPNPIMQAQDVIYERSETVIKKYSGEDSTGTGIFAAIKSLLSGSSSSDETDALGAKMSEDEIKEAAGLYGVSVGDYLTGLDNGKYLTLSGRQKAQQQGGESSFAPAAIGASGLAGIGLLAGSLFGNNKTSRPAPPSQERLDRPGMNGGRPGDSMGRPQGSNFNGNNFRQNAGGSQGFGHGQNSGGGPGHGGPGGFSGGGHDGSSQQGGPGRGNGGFSGGGPRGGGPSGSGSRGGGLSGGGQRGGGPGRQSR